MKGTPKPTWTQGRQAWLALLKQHGRGRPRGTGQGSVATYCRALGWTRIMPTIGHVLTPEGIAVLAEWEAGRTAPPKREPTTVDLARVDAAALASRLVAIDEGLARGVHDALTTYLHAPVARFHPGGKMDAPALRKGELAVVLREGKAIAGPAGFSEPEPAPAPVVVREDPPSAEPAGAELRAPQYGIRKPLAASLGTRTTPSGYSTCLACCGRGTVGFNFLCQPCQGSGRIQRTVEP